VSQFGRVAIVHDWLTGMRGGEAVLEAIIDLFPDADLFSLLHVPGSVSPKISSRLKGTSWLQNIPGIGSKYRHFLPILPQAAESLDFTGYQFIISSSHCVAKGIRKPQGAVHISYIHAPMRYMWDRFDDYFGVGRSSLAVRLAAMAFRPLLQNWDRRVSQADRVDGLIANSQFIAQQIKNHYGRDSTVIYPFTDPERFSRPRDPKPPYLMVGAFAPNKRVDLAVKAFSELRLPLRIVGKGQEEIKLRQMAGPTVEFLGSCSNEQIAEEFSRCRAFIFPGVEDFGITPIEALSAGAPVIAYGAGGVLETVTAQTGLFFDSPSVDSLKEAILKFESAPHSWSESDCRARGGQFTQERFKREFMKFAAETKSRRAAEVYLG
jgi:glycosyltransferase involved in cell wall biosynthesis